MHTSFRLGLICVGLLGLAAAAGCETTATRQQAEMKMVAITDLAQVAGKWEGLVRRVPPSRTDGVTLIVLPDGRFRFTSARTIGLLTGEGTFTLVDGHLTTTTERGTMEVNLFEGEGQRMLRATGQASDGMGFIAELDRSRGNPH